MKDDDARVLRVAMIEHPEIRPYVVELEENLTKLLDADAKFELSLDIRYSIAAVITDLRKALEQ